MPITCVVEFENNPTKIFYAGQLIRGQVKLTSTDKETKVRGAFIQLYGKGFVSWSEGCARDQKSFTDEEYYLNESTYFIGGSGKKF